LSEWLRLLMGLALVFGIFQRRFYLGPPTTLMRAAIDHFGRYEYHSADRRTARAVGDFYGGAAADLGEDRDEARSSVQY